MKCIGRLISINLLDFISNNDRVANYAEIKLLYVDHFCYYNL